ncbi:hypothetical protein NDU88_003714 [Pleurodeles waltl]|uniref:Uncharacterized protein n=1 Tax=Pleurodeles waltl TaxID=8319 RepID=A0AAV7NRM7_PLEWA|nr:hypothetical protein NDU88_003714 [Pleurodeles waltl]
MVALLVRGPADIKRPSPVMLEGAEAHRGSRRQTEREPLREGSLALGLVAARQALATPGQRVCAIHIRVTRTPQSVRVAHYTELASIGTDHAKLLGNVPSERKHM